MKPIDRYAYFILAVGCALFCRTAVVVKDALAAGPSRPKYVYPVKGETNVPLSPTFATEYQGDPENDDHQASQWLICESFICSSLNAIYDSGTTTKDLTSHKVPADILECGQDYHLAALHQDSTGEWSNTTSVKFTTLSCEMSMDGNDPGDNNTGPLRTIDDLPELSREIGELLLPSDDSIQERTEFISKVAGKIDDISGIAAATLKKNNGLEMSQADSFFAASDAALETVWQQLGQDVGVDVGVTLNSEAFQGNDRLVDRVIEVAGIKVTEGLAVEVEPGAVNAATVSVLEDLGVSQETQEKIAAIVIDSLPPVADPAREIFKGSGVTSEFLIKEKFENIPIDINATGNINFSITDPSGLVLGTGGAYVQEVTLVSNSLPDGQYVNRDGSRVIVSDGVSLEISPASHDPISLTGSYLGRLSKETGKDPGERDFRMGKDGRLRLQQAESGVIKGFSGGGQIMAGLAFTTKTPNTMGSATTTFTVSGSDPASEAYTILLEYGDGTIQGMPPAIAMLDKLMAFLESQWPGAAGLNRETGVITVDGLGSWKPDYLVENMTPEELAVVDSADLQYGLRFLAEDHNHDGLVDYWIFDHVVGEKQLLYGM